MLLINTTIATIALRFGLTIVEVREMATDLGLQVAYDASQGEYIIQEPQAVVEMFVETLQGI